MSADRIKTLLQLMRENELVELELEEGDFKVKLRKAPPASAMTLLPTAAASMLSPMAASTAIAPLGAPGGIPLGSTAVAPLAPPPAPVDDESRYVPVKSPIIGVFYAAPNPGADAFVREGATVAKDTIVCIIDAMKTMNEIKAGVAGTVMKILVENGEPVEYDQPLFLIKP